MAPKDPVHAVNGDEEEVVSSASAALEFSDANLRAIAEVFNSEGDEECRKKEYDNAIYFYTEGIKVNCNDKDLNAKLYSNRATAHYCLGNSNEALSDAKTSRRFKALHIEAFTAGAKACLQLNLFEEAITWCDDGLAIDRHNHTLLELKKECITKQCELLVTNTQKMNENDTASVKVGSGPVQSCSLKLDIATKVGNRSLQGFRYLELGDFYSNKLGDFERAIGYYKRYLQICTTEENTAGEGLACGKLGDVYNSVGKFDEAEGNFERQLSIAIELGDKHEEGQALNSLSILNLFHCRGDLIKAVEYQEKYLKICKELGDSSGEGHAYGHLGIGFHRLGDLQKALEYHRQNLKIVMQLGKKAEEGKAYGNLGRVYRSLLDFEQAISYHWLQLGIAKAEKRKADEAIAYYDLACNFESLESLKDAVKHYQSCAKLFYVLRPRHRNARNSTFNDEWKINLFDEYKHVYTDLCRVLSKLNLHSEALLAAEQGRAQALIDFLESRYDIEIAQPLSGEQEGKTSDILRDLPANTVFLGIDTDTINIWLLVPGQNVRFEKRVVHSSSATTFLDTLIKEGCHRCSIMMPLRAFDSSLHLDTSQFHDEVSYVSDTSTPDDVEKIDRKKSEVDQNDFITLYDITLGPIAEHLQGDELVIVPEGSLCLVPFAALVDADSKYLCESFRIRSAPSLTSLKLITQGDHSERGALLVGDPHVVEEIVNERGESILSQLQFARTEVEMIGQIIGCLPLTGKQATKMEVLRRLNSVALIHIAAHANVKSGEIALALDQRSYQVPTREEDFLLTMADVLNVQLRAKLVVLSCCHTGQGEIRAEGVVGIARGFLAAGARCVLVSLWAIDDEATLLFMRSFYQNLVKGDSASEALNKAMKCMRESDEFNEVKYWAPFVLIGDDVTLEFLRPGEGDYDG